ncbi:CPBP family intramembrane metalloprotease [Clostridium sp. 'deep sea']|uniref:CPBP family intramembrane glutamic endopeptidase n=1 Tax=Clostridium sp. 'deep sea' TaxID=2779445 RepID=UPI0018968219|nr:CPBP family intramembrane glutamic endopeptidase [Clostridium sp. 'deep sea']QOR34086.1 CPBP family intramembrane metalloprotease [Clostridium sp. 'deep sea']
MNKLIYLLSKNYLKNEGTKLTWLKLFLSISFSFLIQVILNFFLLYLKSINVSISANNITILNITHNLISIFIIIAIYKWSFVKKKMIVVNMGFKDHINNGLSWGLVVLLVNLLVGLIMLFIYNTLGVDVTAQNGSQIINNITKQNAVLVFLAIVITAPVAEELMFRAVIYKTLAKHFNTVTSLILSGLIFSLLHLDIYYIPQIWIMGTLLAYSYNKTKTLITPIIAHMVVNGMFFLSWLQMP